MKKLLCLTLCLLLVLGTGLVAGASADDKPTLRVLTGFLTYDANTDPAAALIEEITGYKVVYDPLPAENPATKLNAILASKEPYDVMILDYAVFEDTVGLGAYQPLDALLDEYGPQVKEYTTPGLWNNATVEGQVTGIPYRLSIENYYGGLRTRTDLLAEAGIDALPDTPEGLKAALQAVKDELGIVPLTGSGALIDEFTGAFGIGATWVLEDGKLRHRVNTPGAKAYVTYMHDLYADGLLDAEWAQNTAATMQEKFLSGKAAIYRVNWWDEPAATDTLKANFPDATYAFLPPLKDETGEAHMVINRAADRVVVIPKVAEHAEDAMQWINAQVKDVDTFRYLCIGTEGVHYEVVDGEYRPIQPAFTDERGHVSDLLTSTVGSEYGTYWAQTRVRKDDTLYDTFTKIQENIAKATIGYDPVSYMSPNKEYTALIAPVNAYVSDTFLQMIVGTRSLDEWDDFLQEVADMGGEQLEEIVGEWWTVEGDQLQDQLVKK